MGAEPPVVPLPGVCFHSAVVRAGQLEGTALHGAYAAAAHVCLCRKGAASWPRAVLSRRTEVWVRVQCAPPLWLLTLSH